MYEAVQRLDSVLPLAVKKCLPVIQALEPWSHSLEPLLLFEQILHRAPQDSSNFFSPLCGRSAFAVLRIHALTSLSFGFSGSKIFVGGISWECNEDDLKVGDLPRRMPRRCRSHSYFAVPLS
jgi:hypothetical protein